jgi:hypothetical protein
MERPASKSGVVGMTSNTHPSLRVRLTAYAMFAAAPAVLALGSAASSYADTGNISYADTDNGPSSSVAAPHHEPFPGQNPQTDRVWYQTPNHDDKPESSNPLETLFGQFPLGNVGPLGNLGLGNLGFG